MMMENNELTEVLDAWCDKANLSCREQLNPKAMRSIMEAYNFHGKEFCLRAFANATSMFPGKALFEEERRLEESKEDDTPKDTKWSNLYKEKGLVD